MQEEISSALLLCVLGLCSAAADTTVSSKVTLNQMPVCPRNGSLAQLTKMEGAQDMRTCFVACAANTSCSVLHRTNGICYFGTPNQLTRFFNQSVSQSSDPCVSYARTSWGLASKLVVFFDFRQGFSNLVSPGVFDAAPSGSVTRDAQGASLPGSSSDFIEVDTQGGSLISSFLDHPSNFSFFAKVVRQTWYQQSYHYFYDCISTSNAGRFGDRDGRAWVEHRFPGQSDWTDAIETRQSTSSPFRKNNIPQAASLGAVFYGKTLNNFWLNGTDLPTDADQSWSLTPAARCLRLGFDSDSSVSLIGRMTCYAVAKAALSTAEFQQLDQMCPW